MKRGYMLLICVVALGLCSASRLAAQPADGENMYRLAEVNPTNTGTDTVDAGAGRGIWVAHDPDLDNDGLPEIIITDYSDGGRVFVFEMVGNDALEYVWGSKILNPGGGGSWPRSVTTGDFDNNGKQEIVFQVGLSPDDSLRGIYFYEWTGNDNDYGTEPVFKLNYEDIDSAFVDFSAGTTENGMRIEDIDGDGKSEFLYPARRFNFNVSNLYILQVDSGTFAAGTAVVDTEYVYDDMTFAVDGVIEGYSPVGTEIGDVDNDGLDEIIVAGWQRIGRGAGLGFLQIDGPDSYTPGSIIRLGDEGFRFFVVKSKPLFTMVNGEPVIFAQGTDDGANLDKLWVIDGIVSDAFVSASNVTELFTGVGLFSIWDIGDQDHPTQSAGDGFDLYMTTSGPVLSDLEYDGVGSVTDTSSYTLHEVYNLNNSYDTIGGLFNDIYTYPGMDLDNDGLRDLVAAYKGSGIDTLNGQAFTKNTFNIFFFEWGDSTTSKDLVTSVPTPRQLTIITPEDFQLRQNYPNPFNPTTNIEFDLPLDKTVSLKIYNTVGQEIRTLVDGQRLAAGSHTVQWDATDNHGNRVASGVYIYKLVFGNFSKSKQMTLVR